MIRKEAWPFYRTISGVRLYWVLEQPKGPKGLWRSECVDSGGAQFASWWYTKHLHLGFGLQGSGFRVQGLLVMGYRGTPHKKLPRTLQ